MKEKYISLLTIVAAVAIAFLVFYFRGGQLPSTSPSPTPFVPTVENNKEILLKNSRTSFPSSTSLGEISQAKLPAALSVFILPTAAEQKIERAKYQNVTQEGFVVRYKLPATLKLAYDDLTARFLSESSWTIIYDARSNLAALIVMESKNYRAQVLLAFLNDTHTQVDVRVLSK